MQDDLSVTDCFCSCVTFTIRSVGPQDVDAVVRLEKECFSTPWSRASIEKDLSETGVAHYYAAVTDEEEVIGYAGMWLVLDDAQLTNIAVTKSWRRRGVADQLLDYLTKDAKNRGANLISLEVSDQNIPAIGLYEKKNFTKSGLRKNYYGSQGGNAIIMLKKITEDS